jgi:7-keto-8-aminopelargonate synthetase-like enzyme
VLLLDAQVHETVRLAAVHARANGTTVETVPHNSVRAVDRRIRELGPGIRRVWYAADGLYSMYGDLAPAEALSELVERHDRLWLYVDDAHSISWTGRHGRGHALERLSTAALERTVVTGSLNKSFAATGGAITFPDAASRDLVAGLSAPSMFCGPVQPPMLAAVIASAELHRSAEVAQRQSRLLARIRLFNELALARDLPLLTTDETPLRYVGTGPDVVWSLAVRLRDAGFFVNVAVYPAVPSAREGLRLTLTLHQTEADVVSLVDAVADQLPLALADQGRTPSDLDRLRRRVRGR